MEAGIEETFSVDALTFSGPSFTSFSGTSLTGDSPKCSGPSEIRVDRNLFRRLSTSAESGLPSLIGDRFLKALLLSFVTGEDRRVERSLFPFRQCRTFSMDTNDIQKRRNQTHFWSISNPEMPSRTCGRFYRRRSLWLESRRSSSKNVLCMRRCLHFVKGLLNSPRRVSSRRALSSARRARRCPRRSRWRPSGISTWTRSRFLGLYNIVRPNAVKNFSEA